MNFPQKFPAPAKPQSTLAAWVGLIRRAKAAVAVATREYCERQVQRALMIDPASDDRLTVDVHFCDVR